MFHHDEIAKICLTHFECLPKTGKPNASQWTVLSCIVQENANNDSKSTFEVVSLGTGSKCIGRGKLSSKGDILNDSHAEVICRRAFLRYLCEQLKTLAAKSDRKSETSIFYRESTNSLTNYRLKERIKFHFFTTCMPCGDATIFLKSDGTFEESDLGSVLISVKKRSLETEEMSEPELASICKKRKLDAKSHSDIFRTGAKCLAQDNRQDLHTAGSGYHVLCAVRTKPGRGDPTLSVSCSDKLARWCHMGLQGAGLSLLIHTPVLLSSFTIAGGVPYCEMSLRRALYERISIDSVINSTPIVFGQASSEFIFRYGKDETSRCQPCPSSVVWCQVPHKPLEVAVEGRVQGVTKKNSGTKAGRLMISKKELYGAYLEVLGLCQFNGIERLISLTYGEFKNESKTYQNVWKKLKDDGFRVWTEKDKSLLMFLLD